MQHPSIIIVDDEPAIRRLVCDSLATEGWDVLVAANGAEALQIIEREKIDIVILDIMMPEPDGFEICRRLRETSQLPIIMLSARGDVQDKVKCLTLGADDYITKPFSPDELIARCKSVLRRAQVISPSPSQLYFDDGNLEINFAERKVNLADNALKLTPTEYSLLQELVINTGKVLTHSHLLSKVWGPEYRQEREYLHVFIGHLRAKLELDMTNPRYITTVPGVGYQFVRHSPEA